MGWIYGGELLERAAPAGPFPQAGGSSPGSGLGGVLVCPIPAFGGWWRGDGSDQTPVLDRAPGFEMFLKELLASRESGGSSAASPGTAPMDRGDRVHGLGLQPQPHRLSTPWLPANLPRRFFYSNLGASKGLRWLGPRRALGL